KDQRLTGTDFSEGQGNDQDSGVRGLYSNGEMVKALKGVVAGKYTAKIVAYAPPAGDDPACMELRLDGKFIKHFDVKRRRDETFEVEFEMTEGDRRLGLAFTNDFYNEEKKQDRNLYVRSVVLSGPVGAENAAQEKNAKLITVRPDGKVTLEVASRVNLQP